MRTHTNVRPFSCKMCLMTFRCRQSRLNHIRREHTGERPHHCMYCPMKFHDKPNLDNHLVVHTNERNHQCQKCLRRFKTSSHLWRHKKIYSGSRNCITDGRGIRGCRKSDKKSLSDRSVWVNWCSGPVDVLRTGPRKMIRQVKYLQCFADFFSFEMSLYYPHMKELSTYLDGEKTIRVLNLVDLYRENFPAIFSSTGQRDTLSSGCPSIHLAVRL